MEDEVKETSPRYAAKVKNKIPPGYKQTEVGVIPEDWEISSVGVIAEVKTGPFGSSLHEKDYVIEGTPIITVEHLGERGVSHINLPMVSNVDKLRLQAYELQKEDIVFSRVGSVDRNALIKNSENGWLFSGRLLRVRVKQKYIHAPFLSYHFHSEPFKQRVKNFAVGQTMASLNTKILMSVKVFIPPTKAEQEAISEALSDADALIESLEQLIAKKRHIKQGAMQELLTGKRRLPGFKGEWEKIKLGTIGSFLKGSNVNKDEASSGNIPCIRYGEIYTHHNDYIRHFNTWISPDVANKATLIKKGDILFTGSGETKEDIGKCVAFLADFNAYAGGDVIILRPGRGDSKFFGFYLNTAQIQLQKAKKGQGDAIVHISANALSTIDILFPPETEQSAIAEILSDMDTEITTLEEKLSKARQVKQGMMQELLTGRIRLI